MEYMDKMKMSMSKMDNMMRMEIHETDSDLVFAEMMIHHHQGAIDMARIEVEFGKNPEKKRSSKNN